MKIGKILLGAAVLHGFYSCKDKIDPDPWILPPNRFYYQIVFDGARLSDSMLSELKFYYFDENGNKIFRHPRTDNEAANHVLLPSWIYGNEHLDDSGVRLCMEIVSFGVQHNTWYFDYPNGDTDTLYIESKKVSKPEGRQDECYCENPITVVRYNGRDAYKHATLRAADGKPVFVLEKL